ncbi:MAG: site-specific DNA-methyltransferase [Bdellovibrionales bacterium]|nr:site-specific DNA-methyltransferase [Bdellovibrionales bacterium]
MKKSKTRTQSFGSSGRQGHDSSLFYGSKLYKNLDFKEDTQNNIEGAIQEDAINQIFLKSATKMSELPDNTIHLMITSPPYNVSKDYDENLSLEEYLNFLNKVFSETYRVLVNGGRACINIANIGRKPYIPLSDYISKMMIDIGFLMRGEIIWNKSASSGTSTAWGSWCSPSNPTLRDIHEYILIFSKGAYKREKQEKKTTIQKEQFIEWTKSIWNMNTESARKIGHPAPFPEELPFRLMQLYSFENDIVLDPFMGSGTTAVVGLKNGRKFVGYEINEDYVKIASERISNLQPSLFQNNIEKLSNL